MAFESHTDLFTERAPIHPGQQRQIVMERFGFNLAHQDRQL